ncbi:class I adenylate-forming enzyme family protein [Nocardia miyunensis]|uniref:class I adenylate-forming enzyme family protein n=1 Tax=Nocardia miyunensis TaxID=282684 RepID=UPI00082D5A07|nr:class I adenylate-forming enzyme family protein [Nocardia miyunensis]
MALSDKERLELLTTPGAAFPLQDRTVDGHTYQVFDREPRTLRNAFAEMRTHGSARAIGYRDEYWSYDDLWSEMTAVAHALRDRHGVVAGDRVGIAMRNYPEFVMIFGAIQLLGAVAVPFNAWLKGPELAELVVEAAPVALFADRERVELARGLEFAGGATATTLVGVRCPATEGVVAYEDLLTDRRPAASSHAPEVEVSPDDISTILFTSGTTGRPKAAAHSHLNHSASLLNKLIRAVKVDVPADGGPVRVSPAPHSCKLVTFPFFHIAGINTMYNSLYAGQTLILMYKWDAHEAIRLVEQEKVNEISGPPFIVQTFLEAAREGSADLSSLRVLGMGGAAAPLGVIAEARKVLGPDILPRTGYGMTETTSGVVAISGADFEQRPTSVGRLLPTAEIGIMDNNGELLGVDEEGEVAFRGPQVIRGYAGIADSPDFRDGWFFTGDIGRVDKDGFVYLVGRVKDIVIRGGENINCSEVEACLSSHPHVIEAAALGAPHPTLGEELVAIVHVHTDSTVDVDELRDYAAERLAKFKVPVRIAIIHEFLPRTASGKVIKRELIGQLGLGWLLGPETASA